MAMTEREILAQIAELSNLDPAQHPEKFMRYIHGGQNSDSGRRKGEEASDTFRSTDEGEPQKEEGKI